MIPPSENPSLIPSLTPFTPSVSVIVPAFNAVGTLKDCLDSLLTLDYPREKLEIIVVDNSSTDGTPDVLAGYRTLLKVYSEPVRGAGAARNHGLRRALHDIIAFTDADCVVDKDWLRNLVPPLIDPAVGITGGKILSRRPCNRIERFGETIHDQGRVMQERLPTAATPNWASRRATLFEVGLFDERFLRCQDADLSYRLFLAGFRFVYTPKAVVYHRNASALSGLFREGFRHGHGSVRFARKHAKTLREFGRRRIYLSTYRALGRNIKDLLIGDNRLSSVCFLTFNLGKKLGKLTGSIWFRYVDL